MGRIKYLLKRIKTMDKKAMFEKIDSIHKKTGKSKLYLLYDMSRCARKYGAGYMDYDLFEMYNLTPEQRDTYITRGRNNELVSKYNNKDYFHLFENKDEFNTLFKDYIKRDWIKVKGTSKEDIIAFMQRHNEFMAKPVDGGCGHGIVKVDISQDKFGDKKLSEVLPSNENVYDALYKHSDEITHILTSHEQGAAHAADGYARATGKVGVCMATSGPGATNLVTGIATAYMDSIPIVAITANVAVSLLGKDTFQEVDIAGITMPITKHNYIVKDVTKLADTIRSAFLFTWYSGMKSRTR